VLYTEDAVFAADGHYPDIFHHILSREPMTWVSDLSIVLEQHPPVKFMIVAEPPEADRIEAELRERFGGRMGVMRSHEIVVEGSAPGVSKGDGLRRLAAHLGVPQVQTMAIGDQGNDVPMIAWAGVGVAIGGASPAALAAAEWIAPPLEEDGAAAAIERFILRPLSPDGR
jgi:hydroxymethylpyrimidine pyrophosphatase-like HAD family hydrolase